MAPRVRLLSFSEVLAPLFLSQDKPRDIFRQASFGDPAPRELFAPLQAPLKDRALGGFSVHEACQLESYCLVFGAQLFGLFNPARDRAVWTVGFERFQDAKLEAELPAQIEAWLFEIPESLRPAELTLGLVPADPNDPRGLAWGWGLSVHSVRAETLGAYLWPSPTVLADLPRELARSLGHGLRERALDQPPTSLADWVCREVLGFWAQAVLTASKPGSRWLDLDGAAWAKEQAEIGVLAAAEGFDELRSNLYGNWGRFGDHPQLGAVEALDAGARATLEIAFETLRESRDPSEIAAFLYGEDAVRPFGGRGLGLTRGAGLLFCREVAQKNQDRLSFECFSRPSADLLREWGLPRASS